MLYVKLHIIFLMVHAQMYNFNKYHINILHKLIYESVLKDALLANHNKVVINAKVDII